MSLTNEFRSVVSELITTFGANVKYEDAAGKKLTGLGVFEVKRVQDSDGTYVQRETNTFYLQLPATKTTTVKPGEYVIVGNRDYVITTVDASTLDDRGMIVFKLELQK